jgi:hypothetical protein
MNPDTENLFKLAHSKLSNYILPGLNSYLLSQPSSTGCARLFEATREQYEVIAPHSHRFDIACLVLEGRVQNTLWHALPFALQDQWAVSELSYKGKPGEYTKALSGVNCFRQDTSVYQTGDWYFMSYSDIHSITFDKGAVVLFFEGPEKTSTTKVLEPWVDGELCETLKVQAWMFKRGD